LITPLVNLVVGEEEKSELVRRAAELFSLQLSARALCDLELLATGAFSPLDRFMGKADETRFPIPITLEVDQAEGLLGKELALRSAKNNLIAWMKVEEVYDRNYVSGPLRVIELPKHADFPLLRRTPAEVRVLLAVMGKANVVAFHPRNPIDRDPRRFESTSVRLMGRVQKASVSLLYHEAPDRLILLRVLVVVLSNDEFSQMRRDLVELGRWRGIHHPSVYRPSGAAARRRLSPCDSERQPGRACPRLRLGSQRLREEATSQRAD